MATQSFEQLIAGANKIKQNQLPESNTAGIVGEQLIQMVNKQKDEETERMKGITEYNVSVQHPTSGISGTNKYTLEGAIAKIPAAYRRVGIKCSFLDDGGSMQTYTFQGGTFTSAASWVTGSISVVYDLTSAVPTGGLNGGDTYDIATAVKSVADSLQMFIRYLTFKNATGGRELWQFNGTRTASLSEWGKLEKIGRAHV